MALIVPFTIMDDAFESMFFGETGWVMGLLIFLALTIALVIKWKYSLIFIIPIIIGLEEMYYTRNLASPNTYRYAWPMVTLLMFALFMSLYVIFGKEKG